MTFKETYFSDYTTIYEFHKKFYGISGDTEWEKCIGEAKELYRQFEDKPFVKGMIRLVMDELARVDKERKEHE